MLNPTKMKSSSIFLLVMVFFFTSPWFALAGGLNKSTEISAADKPITYASIRKEVKVKTPKTPPDYNKPRPANSYQLAGSANDKLCNEVLEAFNQPSTFVDGGYDEMYWWLNNPKLVEWQPIDVKYEPTDKSFGIGLEYAVVDIDNNGTDEYVYRAGGVLSSNYYHMLGIFDIDLQKQSEILQVYQESCKTMRSQKKSCTTSQLISYALNASQKEVLKQMWITGDDLGFYSTDDKASRTLIRHPIQIGRDVRNLGTGGAGTYFNLMQISMGVVVVSSPTTNFAPPEHLVFWPKHGRNGDLQCILMPTTWHKINFNN